MKHFLQESKYQYLNNTRADGKEHELSELDEILFSGHHCMVVFFHGTSFPFFVSILGS
jgi:hypothetical protein